VQASVLLLGHTLDDQAETVLLGLARGSGGRSLQGMRRSFDLDGVLAHRPLLGLTRAQTEAACTADGITWWQDPQNADAAFTRSRVRHAVMPVLESELGPGVAEALARTGEQLREDMAALDAIAEEIWQKAVTNGGVNTEMLNREPVAIRSRVVRAAAIASGAIASELTYGHVQALLALGAGKEIQLPGHLTGYRDGDLLLFRKTD
jgi:tRNA(Ile)-lysidine synthase